MIITIGMESGVALLPPFWGKKCASKALFDREMETLLL